MENLASRQPCWYDMKVPQFVRDTCVVCYQPKLDCERQFGCGELTLQSFHRSPFVLQYTEPADAVFSYSIVQIPEHHWTRKPQVPRSM